MDNAERSRIRPRVNTYKSSTSVTRLHRRINNFLNIFLYIY